MAKIKINKLPKGFKLVDGKVVQEMNYGGMVYTGDQANYGLVTTPQEFYGETNFNNTRDEDVRYSLSAVPRDNANIEAEGGETVLTDLNNDGNLSLVLLIVHPLCIPTQCASTLSTSISSTYGNVFQTELNLRSLFA